MIRYWSKIRIPVERQGGDAHSRLTSCEHLVKVTESRAYSWEQTYPLHERLSAVVTRNMSPDCSIPRRLTTTSCVPHRGSLGQSPRRHGTSGIDNRDQATSPGTVGRTALTMNGWRVRDFALVVCFNDSLVIHINFTRTGFSTRNWMILGWWKVDMSQEPPPASDGNGRYHRRVWGSTNQRAVSTAGPHLQNTARFHLLERCLYFAFTRGTGLRSQQNNYTTILQKIQETTGNILQREHSDSQAHLHSVTLILSSWGPFQEAGL